MELTLKYRPKTIDDVVGQKTVVDILKSQFANNSFRSVYLFAGAWGTGKTSMARVFAHTINGPEYDPIELDAASNNGVDNVRSIIVEAHSRSILGEYKFFIIDECHMLTPQAWAAALKIVEEPPEKCIFIFCTTNPEKVPMTILSRVQRLDFRRIDKEDIYNRLIYILNNEHITNYNDDAIRLISTACDGHLRDAVKTLDRCISIGQNITIDLVETLIGVVKTSLVKALFDSYISKDVNGILAGIDKAKSYNADMLALYTSLLNYGINHLLVNINDEKVRGFVTALFNNRNVTNTNAEMVLRAIAVGVANG